MMVLTQNVILSFEDIGAISKDIQIQYLNEAPIEELEILCDYGYKFIYSKDLSIEERKKIVDFVKMPNVEREQYLETVLNQRKAEKEEEEKQKALFEQNYEEDDEE